MSLANFRFLNLLQYTRSISLRASRMDQKLKAVKEVEQALSDNPYYSKYADKIKKLPVAEMEVSAGLPGP